MVYYVLFLFLGGSEKLSEKRQFKEEIKIILIVPKCVYCKKDIKKDEQALVIIPYPKKKGFTEIKAFLNSEENLFVKTVKINLAYKK